MSLIIFLRHAQAKNNVERILAGRRDGFPLTEKGLQQAENIGRFLKPLHISAIYSSPIERAINTAQLVSKQIGVDIFPDPRLTEIDMGLFSGMFYEDMFSEYGNVFLKFYQDNPIIEENGVETFSNVKQRVLDLVSHCSKKHSEENVLLVTHMDPIKAMLSTVLHLKPESLYELVIRNASLTILKKEENNYSLAAINSMDIERYIQD